MYSEREQTQQQQQQQQQRQRGQSRQWTFTGFPFEFMWDAGEPKPRSEDTGSARQQQRAHRQQQRQQQQRDAQDSRTPRALPVLHSLLARGHTLRLLGLTRARSFRLPCVMQTLLQRWHAHGRPLSYDADHTLRRHLNVLGLPAATALDSPAVRQAYLKSAREWHPDRHAGVGKVAAEERFKGIQHAYHSLCAYVRTKRLPEDE